MQDKIGKRDKKILEVITFIALMIVSFIVGSLIGYFL
jgi:hypothetical protein